MKPDTEVKILVVEDEDPIRILTQTILEKAGYTVLTAADGKEAQHNLPQIAQEIDLLITDLLLPGLSGDDLASKARELNPEIKIIFASGSFGAASTDNYTRIDGAILLTKPFTPVQLMVAVRRALAGI
jgi:CheY-like chemotaxis protein